jgi:hypothetical protein
VHVNLFAGPMPGAAREFDELGKRPAAGDIERR